MLYSTFGLILRWSYGVRLLAQADDPMESPIRLPADGDEEGERRIRDLEALLPSTSTSTVVDISTNRSNAPSIVIDNSSAGEPSPSESLNKDTSLPVRPGLAPNYVRKSSYFFRSFPNSPNQSRISLVNPEDIHVEGEEEDGGQNAEPFARQPLHRRQSSHYSVQSQSEAPTALQAHILVPLANFWHVFTDFMTVPLYAAFLSIIVALTPAMQHTLEVHLYPIKGALESSGSCSIPVTLVVLGAYFYKETDSSIKGKGIIPTRMEGMHDAGVIPNGDNVENRSSLPTPTGPSAVEHCRELFTKLKSTGKARKQRPPYLQPEDENRPLPGETKTVIVTLLSRMVLTPLVLMPLVTLAAKEDWHQVFEDPVFVVSNVLLIASPPALALAQITQAASGDAFERLISRTIFWSYCVATPPLMIAYVVVGLLLTGI
jgi:predicted permease